MSQLKGIFSISDYAWSVTINTDQNFKCWKFVLLWKFTCYRHLKVTIKVWCFNKNLHWQKERKGALRFRSWLIALCLFDYFFRFNFQIRLKIVTLSNLSPFRIKHERVSPPTGNPIHPNCFEYFLTHLLIYINIILVSETIVMQTNYFTRKMICI